MYPNLYYALKEIFGIELHWTKMFNSFGILLALSFAAAAVVLHKEFKRRRLNGTFTSITENVVMGAPVDWKEYLVQGIIGFLIGYKIIGGIISGDLMNDAQAYIGSSKGNIFSGIALAALFIYIRYNDFKKLQKKYPTPTKVTQEKWPEQRVGDFTIMAAVAGLLGAKLFHFFENWSSFVKAPIENLLSPSGLTFYGGLIVAAIVLLYYAKKVKINWKHLCDSVAPGLMIAYAIGRLGCQISGDGDWGIYNSAYISTPEGKVVLATPTNNMDTALAVDKRNAKINGNDTFYHFRYDIKEFGAPIHKPCKAPSFLPSWAVAMNYAHNVNEEGWQIKGCDEKYCTMLPVPVFPTPLYEFIMCTIMFFILWGLRKKITIPGVLFGIYLMMNGAERFLIEKIRVNTLYHVSGLSFSQAELISTALFIGGIFIIWYSRKTKHINNN